MSGTFQSVDDLRTSERRYSPRQRVSFACIELDDDNGGLILDISERGLSVQAVAILTDDDLTRMRFQLSPSRPGIETRGRIAWIGASMKRAGLEFIGLPDEARDQIKQWISLELQANESVEEITLKKLAPSKGEPENIIPFPEPETMRPVAENQNRHSIADDAVEGPPRVEKVLPYSKATSPTSGVTENVPGTTVPLLTWPELEAKLNRQINSRKPTSFSRASGQLIGLSVGTVLLLSGFFFLGYHLQKSKYSQQRVEAIASAKAPESSTDSTANPANLPVAPAPPLDGPGFMIQVGAMTHKENADALAEALQRRNFPAFVSPPGTDRFYLVVVGPYRDADATLKAKEELKEEGFESIRTPWKPLTEQAPHSARLR
jgi:septal ring-binding cell division protein DamX